MNRLFHNLKLYQLCGVAWLLAYWLIDSVLCCIVLYWDIYQYETTIYLFAKMSQSHYLMVLTEQ